MDAFKNLIDSYLKNAQYGILSLVIDACLIIGALILISILLYRTTKKKISFIFNGVFVLLIIISILVDTKWVQASLLPLYILGVLGILIIYGTEQHHNQKNLAQKTTKEFIKSESDKNHLIDVLLQTVEYFSSRQIGAIITIEKENNLNVYIQKAVMLNADVSFELLESIFHPNTALHDGATIIRGGKIMCAGAFYTPSDKADIPSHYGSRHRAAIGISEESDAFTIVVSEETGNIAATVEGTITGELTLDTLKNKLQEHIIVQ